MKPEENLDDPLIYCREQIEGGASSLTLPSDRPRPAILSLGKSQIDFAISHTLNRKLNALAESTQTSLFIILLASFYTLLFRYSGQNDIAVGTPKKDIKNGFINILALRVQLQPQSSFVMLIDQLKKVVHHACKKQNVPLERLIDYLNAQENLSYSPFSQVMFELFSYSPESIQSSGLKLDSDEVTQKIEQCDLVMKVYETNKDIWGCFSYCTDLFNKTTIKRMVSHWQNLLIAITEDPKMSIDRLPILKPAEHNQLIYGWNDTKGESQGGISVHTLFENQVIKSPSAIALAMGDNILTYQALNNNANQLAHFLIKQGVNPDTLIAVCLERSLDLITTYLAILKAGGAYVPLDPTLPIERLNFITDDTQSSILISKSDLMEKLKIDIPSKLFCIDTLESTIKKEPKTNLSCIVLPSNLVYVIYTSGSTGLPKGVLIEHKGLSNFVSWYQRDFKLNSSDIISQFHSPAFDIFNLEVWACLAHGGCLKLITEDDKSSPDHIFKWIRDEGITICCLPVSIVELLLEYDWTSHHALRILQTGGEKFQHLPKKQYPFDIYNLYGPTETTIVSTGSCIYQKNQSSSDNNQNASPPIGKPITNTQAYILDVNLNPVPAGVIAELYIGGAGVARGYLNRPELTKQKFIPNPFESRHQERIYKTGDLCCWLASGEINFVGRVDYQVKIRGFRIELGEVEAQLELNEKVQKAIVIAHAEELLSDKRLVAYLVARDKIPTDELLRLNLKQHLPSYMIPSQFIWLDSMPLNNNGKVDRKKLPIPSWGDKQRSGIAPAGFIEEIVAKAWQAVLHVPVIYREDDFIDLGGNSLSLMRVLSLIEQQLHLPLSRFEFIKARNLIQFSSLINKQLNSSKNNSKPKINKHGDRLALLNTSDTPITLSMSQVDLLQIEKSCALIGIPCPIDLPVALRFMGRLNINALESAINDIIEKHMPLRIEYPQVPKPGGKYTVFFLRNLASFQWVVKLILTYNAKKILNGSWKKKQPVVLRCNGQLSLQVEKLNLKDESSVDEFLRSDKLSLWFYDDQRNTSIPIKTRLIEINRNDYILLISINHLSADGYSIKIFIDELVAFYAEHTNSSQACFTPGTLITNWFERRDKERNSNYSLSEEELQYCKNIFKKIIFFQTQHLSFYCGERVPIGTKQTNSNERVELNSSTMARVNYLAKKNKTSVFVVMLAYIAIAIAQRTQQKFIPIYTYFANRDGVGERDVIGFYATAIPLIIETDKLPIDMIIQNIEKCIENGMRIIHIPWPWVQSKMALELIKEPLPKNVAFPPKISFDIRNLNDETIGVSNGLKLKEYYVPDPSVYGFLQFNLIKKMGKHTIELRYSPELYVADEVNQMLISFIDLLGSSESIK